MVNEGSGSSYSGGFEFRRREKCIREQECNSSKNIITDFHDIETEIETETETTLASESIDQTKNEDELVSYNNMDVDDKGEKEKTEDDELCVLKDALEAVTSFQGLSQYQKKLVFQNLKNLGAESRKNVTDEWKQLNVEELHLNVKKQTFFAKFANAVV